MPLAATAGAGTRERILDAAEALFIEHGYAGTSLRAITSAAEVNLAAAHYHFGSKFDLLAAVFHRRVQPVERARQAALDALEQNGKPFTVRDVVRAFLSPMYGAEADDLLDVLPDLIGRIYAEPEALTKPLLEGEFANVAARYQGALAKALPDVSPGELRWRFHFMIGAMIQLLRFRAPLGLKAERAEFVASLDRLVDFVVAGLQQPETGAQSAGRDNTGRKPGSNA